MAEDVSFLRDIFNVYYEKAKSAHAAGNYALAKRNYLLAGECMLKISKSSQPALRKAQYDRAKRLIEIAESLDEGTQKRIRPVNQQQKQRPSSDDGQKNQNMDQDDDGKEWNSSEIPDIKFEDVAGLEDVKKTIMTRMINPLKYPEKYAKYGKKIGGGVLLYGPPGTGKTMIAKAIAGEVGAAFYAIKGSDILSKYVGESEKNISSLFETAKQQELSIIFIDEMDSLFATRGQDIHNDKRVNEFLQQIDGFASKNDNLLILGATNRPWDVDKAAIRSGRFSEKIYVSLPDAPAREYLLSRNLKKIPLADDVDFDKIVELTEGYSGADLAEVCDRAKEEPLEKYIETDVIVPVSMKDILDAIKKVPPTVKPQDLIAFEEYGGFKHKPEKKKEEDIKVTFVENTFYLGRDDIVLKFVLSKDFDKIYLNIDGSNYVCNKKSGGWVSEKLNIVNPGEYEVIISSSNEIAREKIKIIKGLEEDDLGL